MSGPAPRAVAAFDFDRTLTNCDTLRLFLNRCAGAPRLYRATVRHLPSVVRGLRGGPVRDAAKQRIVQRLLAGRSFEEVQAAASATAEQVKEDLLRPDTVAWLQWHLAQQHRVIIVTASIDLYVKPVAAALGVTDVLATRLDVDVSGCLTGALRGPNVRGAQKAHLLAAALEPGEALQYAYGDSTGDREMLKMAERPCWVRRRPLAPPGI